MSFSEAEMAWVKNGKRIRILKEYSAKQLKLHPTQKPINLMKWCLTNYSKENDIILDPFLGSGSTLIACEKTNRKCYGMEIDPIYCDVIVQRWENFTGRKAQRP